MVFDMTEGVDHIGIATHSLDAHSKFWTSLGFIHKNDDIVALEEPARLPGACVNLIWGSDPRSTDVHFLEILYRQSAE